MFHRRAMIASLAGLSLAAPSLAQAPAWPNGPIRIIAPFPPGGSVDTITRLLQPRLAAELGVPVVVENRPGASGALGTQAASRAPADGNSWVTVFDTHAVNPCPDPQSGLRYGEGFRADHADWHRAHDHHHTQFPPLAEFA